MIKEEQQSSLICHLIFPFLFLSLSLSPLSYLLALSLSHTSHFLSLFICISLLSLSFSESTYIMSIIFMFLYRSICLSLSPSISACLPILSSSLFPSFLPPPAPSYRLPLVSPITVITDSPFSTAHYPPHEEIYKVHRSTHVSPGFSRSHKKPL